MKEISSEELNNILKSNGQVFILDVREPMEIGYGAIPTSHLIPMNQIENRLEEIPKNKKVVVYCRSGSRSSEVVSQLKRKGYSDIFNLKGGILKWGLLIDKNIKQYECLILKINHLQ